MQSVDPTIAKWQANRREIGVLEFSPSDTAAKRFPYWLLPASATFLGVVECDALCLMEDGSLRLFDHEAAERTLCMAAPGQLSLISALSELDAFFSRTVDNDALADDKTANIEMREKYTELLGGEQYATFAQMFFWHDS